MGGIWKGSGSCGGLCVLGSCRFANGEDALVFFLSHKALLSSSLLHGCGDVRRKKKEWFCSIGCTRLELAGGMAGLANWQEIGGNVGGW